MNTAVLAAPAVLVLAIAGLVNARLRFFLLMATLFLESTDFSFESPIGRLRPDLLVIMLLAGGMMVDYIIESRRFRLDLTGWMLAAYIGTNVLSFTRSADPHMSLRIIGLLGAWLIVHVAILTHCTTERRAAEMFRWFVGFMGVQAVIGILQMVGTFVRPTGTIGSGDSDYFALVMMIALLLMNVLQVLKVELFGPRADRLLTIGFALNTLLSFVRSAWIGYLGGILALCVLVMSGRFGKVSSRLKNLAVTAVGVTVIVFTAFGLSPSLREFFWLRLSLNDNSSLSIKSNTRLVLMAASWNGAMQSPIIGNGPGAFSTQGQLLDIDFSRNVAFDPSIATTLMNDTGIVGTLVFAAFAAALFFSGVRAFKTGEGTIWGPLSLAHALASLALLMSYVMTNGLWLPFSWVFFSFGPVFVHMARGTAADVEETAPESAMVFATE